MANEKIRCKNCRKRFEPDLYSGLCPKCGTYNGRRMDTSALEQYISSGDQGEREHRELHEKYDNGYEKAHPDPTRKAALLQEAREQFAKRQTLLNGKPVKRSALPVFLFALVITIVISAAIIMISGVYWNLAFIQEAGGSEYSAAQQPAPGKAVFDQELLESPITIEVHEAGVIEAVEELEGKSLYGIFASGGSEAYNFDARVTEVFLRYELEGDVYYKMPLDSYSLEDFCKEHNIWENDILSAYGLGNGETEEGYYFFIVDSDAGDYSLLLQLTRSEDPSVVLQEALIELEKLPELTLTDGEVESYVGKQ